MSKIPHKMLGFEPDLTNLGDLADLTTIDKDTVVTAINSLVTLIGSLSSLTTTTKTSIVAAINSIITERGALSSLTTSTKTSIVTAINTLVTRIATLEGYKHTLYDYIDSISTSSNGAGLHNSIYRGQSLGSSLTSTQCSNISSGTFKGLYIGDYWTISSRVYRIADFDYWYNIYDNNLNGGGDYLKKHHVVLVPDDIMYSAKMNSSNVTTGGYVGSAMYTTNLANAKSTINSAFGSNHVLKHKLSLTNAVSNGKPSGSSYYDSTVDLMSEIMVYGCMIFTPANDGSTVPALYTFDKSQLNLFKHRHDLIALGNSNNYWLRDVVNATSFVYVNEHGGASNWPSASYSCGVRPAFAIC